MRSARGRSATLVAAAVALTAGVATAWAGAVASDNTGPLSPAASYLQNHPQTDFYRTNGRITTVYGNSFALGQSAQASVDAFINEAIGLFGVSAGELVPGSLAGDGQAVRQIYPNPDGSLKFTLTQYLQQRDGIPVYRGTVKFLTRNEVGNPLVLVRSDLRPLGDFVVNQAVAANPDLAAGMAQAELRIPAIRGGQFTVPETVIWAGLDERMAEPRLAVVFTATKDNPWDPTYAKWLIVADAATGQTLWTENQVCSVDVSGTVRSTATTGIKAAECDPEGLLAMPYARVSIGATVAYADVNGNFTIPNAGNTTVNVVAGPRGRYFRTFNPTADAPTVTLPVLPPGPAAIIVNPDNTNAQRLAETNAYIQANVVRDNVVHYAPTFPTIPGQFDFRVNTGVSGTCNAFYDGSSINFYNNGGGCSNTAYSDVVHHEYGHHVVSMGGSGQDQYGEGTGDCMGVLISDQPILGYGFQGNCNAGIRNANNTKQYPQSGEVHDAGMLISGCLWSVRNELVNAGVGNYRDVLGRCCINAVDLHTGGTITPQITIDWLTLDDTDGNIFNGTPHYQQINAGFTAHNMAGPALQLLNFTFPDGLPVSVTPNSPRQVRVDVTGNAGTPQPGTGTVTFKIDAGSFSTVAMSETSANHYVATLPAAPCGSTISYYFSARTTDNSPQSSPANAPTSAYSTSSAYNLTTRFNDNGQTNPGWTVSATAATGGWQRGVPNGGGGRGDPPTDGDGSGACWITQNGAGDTDVDGGTVTLTSPVMDASGGTATISYWRWFANNVPGLNDTQDDQFKVDISGNNGGTWTRMETVGPTGPDVTGGWRSRAFDIPAGLATNQFRVRFIAEDINTGSIVEAGVDGVRLTIRDCTAPPCPPDFNGDGFLDFFDIDAFVECFEGAACPPGKTADYNGDGFVDFFDIDAYTTDFDAGC